MAWGRKRRFLESPPLDPSDARTTIVASGLVLEGDVVAAGDASVAGTIEGRLEVKGRLHVVEGGAILGEIDAGDAKIDGEVEGPVRVRGRLEVGATARIEGDLEAERIAVAEGAVVRGALNSRESTDRFVERRTRS